MKNWQPGPHFGLIVLATYFLGFIAMVFGLIITTSHWHVTVNASNNVMMLCFAAGLLLYTRNLSFTILMHTGVDTLAGLNHASMISYVGLNR